MLVLTKRFRLFLH